MTTPAPAARTRLRVLGSTYRVRGRYTSIHLLLRTGINALDLIRGAGHRLGPVQVCHAHRLVHILVDADQAARFEGIPGVLATADDSADCGHHRDSEPYRLLPHGGDTERVDADVLHTLLTDQHARGSL